MPPWWQQEGWDPSMHYIEMVAFYCTQSLESLRRYVSTSTTVNLPDACLKKAY